MSPTQTICTPAARVADWFLRSGIQEEDGGVARYYRADEGRNARVSTEITGYVVSALSYLHRRRGDAVLLAAARRAADFLVGQAWDERLRVFPFEHDRNGDAPEPLAYFFDSGIIVRGLLAVWRATGEQAYLAAAVSGGDSMAEHFRTRDTLHPILRLPELRPLPYASQWSRSPGCYQLKAAMAWFDLAEATGDPCWREYYESALQQALATHRSFLPAESPEKTMDRLHAYCYFLEGCLPASERPEVRDAMREGIRQVADYLHEIRPVFVRSDVYAQLLRVRLFGKQRAEIDVDGSEAEDEFRQIGTFQLSEPDRRRHGGYAFGRHFGEIIPHVNPVSASFCSQAVEMWADYQNGEELKLSELI